MVVGTLDLNQGIRLPDEIAGTRPVVCDMILKLIYNNFVYMIPTTAFLTDPVA